MRVPRVFDALSTRRLLTMEWLDGDKLMDFENAPQRRAQCDCDRAVRRLVAAVLAFRGHPRRSASWQLFGGRARAQGAARHVEGVNLFDYGCIRIFPASFVGGVVELYEGLKAGDEARVVHAYEIWGFKRLSRETIAALNIWARFIYGPLIEDRVRTIADGVKPGEYGRREAFAVAKALKAQGPLKVPREFVFMDRAAIGLGGAFLRLRAELNFHRLFEEAISAFAVEGVAAHQAEALAGVGLANGDAE